MRTCPRRAASAVVLVLSAVLALAGCKVSGGATQVTDDAGRCTAITVPSVDASAPAGPTTLPGVVLAPCPTSAPPVTTTAAPSTSTTTPTSSTTPGTTTAAPAPRTVAAYLTGYSWHDNTPPGSPAISDPQVHRQAGGVGTYDDPITVAVGHDLSSGADVLDWPAGTRFYLPTLRRYLMVEDTCGDGPTPERGPCHTGYPAGASTWLDVWVDGRDGTAAQAEACMAAITKVAQAVVDPPSNYVVAAGPIAAGGGCSAQYGDTPSTGTPAPTTTPSTSTTVPPPTPAPTTTTVPITTTVPPTSSSTSTPLPPAEGKTAAATYGWGTPIAAASDEFNDTTIDRTRWGLPGECWPANGTVRGGRCASHNAEAGGYVRQTMTADGKTGYMSNRYGQRYGRWEVRARVTTAAPGRPAHPNYLLWPDSERWPSGGEYDYMEVSSDDTRASAYIHHPTQSGVVQDIYHSGPLDFGQWHAYAIEWVPGHVRGFIDGVQWFDDTDPAAQAPGPMHGTIQLDNFVGTSGMATVHMDTDWFRVYAAAP